MKTILRYLTVILLCFSTSNIKAQHAQLWGMTSLDIFHFNSDTLNLRVDYNFPLTNDAKQPLYSSLTDGLNGKLYGFTYGGGLNDFGVLFEYDTTTGIYTKKIDFDTYGVKHPEGALTLYNGKFYGVTSEGGTGSSGTIFEWDPNTNIYITKYNFLGGTTDGQFPNAGLTLYNGKFYGTTYFGGVNGGGAVFEFNPSNDIYTLKKFLTGNNSPIYPRCAFTVIGSKLYGTGTQGGAYNSGGLFEYDVTLDTIKLKASFDQFTNGKTPYREPVFYNNKLYGLTYEGGSSGYGVLYSVDTNTFAITNLVNLNMVNGTGPAGTLTIVGNKLYGVCQQGGTTGQGTLIEYIPSSSTFTVKINGGSTNELEYSTTTLTNVNGVLYGLSNAAYDGNIFKYTPSTNSVDVKIRFNNYGLGRNPNGSLTFYNGKYYGMTGEGGIYNKGVIFEYNAQTQAYSKKHDFNGVDGSGSFGSLVLCNGKFYGVNAYGGANNKGTIFEYNPANNIVTKKIDFDITNGSLPGGELTMFNGKFYGLTIEGGANNLGTIFEWDTTLNVLTTVFDFDGTIGSYPNASMTLFGNKLFGLTNTGGTDDAGVIFEFDPAAAIGSNVTLRYEFQTGTTGAYPLSNMSVFGGKLYGTTETGGSTDEGVIFEFNPTTSVYTKKVSFDGTNKGSHPRGGLKACNGKFYGMTGRGGVNDLGVLFEWNPSTNAFVRRINFDAVNGSHPGGTTLIASNAIPALNNAPVNQSVCSGSTQHFSFDITDADNDPLTFITSSSNISLIPNAGINVTNVSGSTYQISFTPIPGQTDSSTITVTANDGNNGEVSFSFQVIVSSPLNQSMCLVTVDTLSTHNIVIWEKPITTAIDSFKIWRVQTASIDTLVGTVAYNSLSEFHDYSCNPNVTQYDYKISVLDTCGNESAKSLIHRTILMTTVPGFNQVVLNWNQYVLNNITNGGVNQYRVWRDSTLTGNNWQQIAQLSPASTTYIDNNWPGTGSWRYRIDVDWTNICTPTARTNAAATNTTRSNTRDNYRLTGLSQLDANNISLFPNPASELVSINLNANACINNINVIDATGRLVKTIASTNKNNQTQINTSDLAKGIYFIEVNTNVGIVRKSFVKE